MTVSGPFNTILLRRDPGMSIEEALAGGTVKPGHLLALQSDGDVEAHAVEGGYAEMAVATEDALQGDPATASYAEDDLVSYAIVPRGCPVQMWLKAGENVAKGDKLMSAGDGTLKKWVTPAVANSAQTLNPVLTGEAQTLTLTVNAQNDAPDIRVPLAVAGAALDLSGQGAVDTFLTVRPL